MHDVRSVFSLYLQGKLFSHKSQRYIVCSLIICADVSNRIPSRFTVAVVLSGGNCKVISFVVIIAALGTLSFYTSASKASVIVRSGTVVRSFLMTGLCSVLSNLSFRYNLTKLRFSGSTADISGAWMMSTFLSRAR